MANNWDQYAEQQIVTPRGKGSALRVRLEMRDDLGRWIGARLSDEGEATGLVRLNGEAKQWRAVSPERRRKKRIDHQ